MLPRALSPAEENAAHMAFATLQKKKLLKVNTVAVGSPAWRQCMRH